MTRLIGITMGCPAGIGPEILVRFLAAPDRDRSFMPVVVGDLGVMNRCAAGLGVALRFAAWQPDLPLARDAVSVLTPCPLDIEPEWGRPTAATGRAMGRYIEVAAELTRAGRLAALVTCPVSKGALQAGGYRYPGHTEMLAELCGSGQYAMMMAGGRLRVSLVTIHVPLRAVPALICRAAVLEKIIVTGRALRRDFAIDEPRIAVAALNPHGGEAGIMGGEEEREIAAAVVAAAKEGWQASGPYPADSLFYRAAAGGFDAVVAMYHDQGLVPFKLLHFQDGVNVTIGLPIIRTSVDHGTAYDIAGRGIADPASLAAAYSLAVKMAVNRERVA